MEIKAVSQAAIFKTKFSNSIRLKDVLIWHLHAEEWWKENVKPLFSIIRHLCFYRTWRYVHSTATVVWDQSHGVSGCVCWQWTCWLMHGGVCMCVQNQASVKTHTPKASAVGHSLDLLHVWYWSNFGLLYIEKTLPLLSFCEPQLEFATYM